MTIETDRVTAYTARRQTADHAAKGTINRELAALKRMFRLGLRAKKVLALPFIPMLKEQNARKGFFEREQFQALHRHLPEHLRGVVTVAYVTGWRLKSELLTRQWQHVDFHANWLRLDPGETKTDEGRQFPLIGMLREVLEAQREYTDRIQKETRSIIPWVFHKDGRPLKHFRRSWLTACKQAGPPGRIPHDFRRTAVRNLERSGVSRSAAMEMVGHKTESIYRRHAIVSEGDIQRAGQQLAQLHSQEAPIRGESRRESASAGRGTER